MIGQVIKLDRGFPLVLAENGVQYRCEHATSLVKGETERAVIGDKVRIALPQEHDKAIIEEILPRANKFVRKDPTERAVSQVLAANFDTVIIVQPANDLNHKRLERELVLAHETGARVVVALTKADLVADSEPIQQEVQHMMRNDELVVASIIDGSGIAYLKDLIPQGTTAILLGKSGVGKSSLVNALVGHEIQETTEVRATDGKGRHTTVSREMISIPDGGFIVDMPGVRGLGLWDAEEGIEAAFNDVEAYAEHCRFRDCKHEAEPGCAVREAVEQGSLSAERFKSYLALKQESTDIRERRDEAKRIRHRTGHPRHRDK